MAAATQGLCKGGQQVDLDCEECLNRLVADGTCQKCHNVGCPKYDKTLDDLLVKAAENGKTKAMEILLKAGVNINCVDYSYGTVYTPLKAATCGNQIEAVRLIVNWPAQAGQSNERLCSADLSKSDNRKCSATASQSDDTKVSVSIDKPDGYGRTALISATCQNHREIAEILVEAGANLNCTDRNGKQAIHYAVKKGHTRMLQLLLKAGAEIHCKNNIGGHQPIHYAARYGHTGIIKILMESGADVNCNIFNGNQPIHLAVERGHTAIIEILVQAGASVNCRNNNGWQPLHYAAQHGHTGIIELLLQGGAKGASVNTENSAKETPLILAARHGETQTVQFLLGKGADVEIEDVAGNRALHHAAESGHVDTMATLIRAGAKVNCQNRELNTPMIHHFIQNPNYRRIMGEIKTQIIKMLLSAGADMRIQSRGSLHSVLDTAIVQQSGNDQQLALLYTAGAPLCQTVSNASEYREIIPQFILGDQEPMLDLQGLCRRKIRYLLLSPARGNHKNLNSTVVAKLPLPQSLTDFLLFNVNVKDMPHACHLPPKFHSY